MFRNILLTALAIGAVHAQTASYTGCHNHGSVEYCFGPDGEETAMSTQAAATATSVPASTTSSADSAAITGCHNHGDDVFCIESDGSEVQVSMEATPTGEMPAEYTGCHSHGDDRYVFRRFTTPSGCLTVKKVLYGPRRQ